MTKPESPAQISDEPNPLLIDCEFCHSRPYYGCINASTQKPMPFYHMARIRDARSRLEPVEAPIGDDVLTREKLDAKKVTYVGSNFNFRPSEPVEAAKVVNGPLGFDLADQYLEPVEAVSTTPKCTCNALHDNMYCLVHNPFPKQSTLLGQDEPSTELPPHLKHLKEVCRHAVTKFELTQALTSLAAANEREKELKSSFGITSERERTALADAITRISKAIAPRMWLVDGRGCYEWDDDTYRKEFGWAMNEVLDAIDPLRKIASDWTTCPMKAVEVEAARMDWKTRAELAESHLSAARLAVGLVLELHGCGGSNCTEAQYLKDAEDMIAELSAAKIEKEAAIARAEKLEFALREAVAIFHGELGHDWGTNYGPFYDMQSDLLAAPPSPLPDKEK